MQSVEFGRSFGGCLAEILWQWQWFLCNLWRVCVCVPRFMVFNFEILSLGWVYIVIHVNFDFYFCFYFFI